MSDVGLILLGAFGFFLALTAIVMDWVDSRTTEYQRYLKEWNKKP